MKIIKYLSEYLGFKLFYPLLSSIPYKLRIKIGAYIGLSVFYLYKRRRNIALENIKNSFPELSDDRHRILCRESFRHFGIGVMEFLQLGRLDIILLINIFP